LEVIGIVFNSLQKNFPQHEESKEFIRKVASENDWYIFNTEIKYSRSYPTGSSQGTHISNTDYTRSTVKENFTHFVHEFIKRIPK
jgi:chromosome partitioning protein